MGAKKAIIIGAGIGGLAAAVRLRLKGFDVQVFEANAYPGGKLSEVLLGNYRFDAGPSLFTMPELVDELFVLAGKKPEDYFQYQRLDESCRYFFEDGTRIRAFDSREKLLEELHTKTAEPLENIEKALHNSHFLFESLSGLFMFRPIHKLSTWLAKEAFRTYLRIPRLSFFKTMAQTNEKRFLSPKLRQIFNRYATYNGSDPWQAPATLHIIPHLEFNKGAFFSQRWNERHYPICSSACARLGREFPFHYCCKRNFNCKG
jgi:phytoene dehydrogenase-like protein